MRNYKSELVVIYNRNLKMPEGKLASQVAHCCLRYCKDPPDKIIVLGYRDTKFKKLCNTLQNMNEDYYIHHDPGYNLLDAGTPTCVVLTKDLYDYLNKGD